MAKPAVKAVAAEKETPKDDNEFTGEAVALVLVGGAYQAMTLTLEGGIVVGIDRSEPNLRLIAESDFKHRALKLWNA